MNGEDVSYESRQKRAGNMVTTYRVQVTTANIHTLHVCVVYVDMGRTMHPLHTACVCESMFVMRIGSID